MDPFDYMLKRFGENLVGIVAIIAACAVVWLGGGL